MSYIPSDDKTLGIDLDGDQLLAAFLTNKKGHIHLERLEQKSIKEIENVKPLYIEGKDAKDITGEYLPVSGLDAYQVLVRRIRLKLTRDKDIEEAYPFQAEPLLPYPIENALIDKMIIEKQDGTTLLSILATRKEDVQSHIEQLEGLQLSPEIISCDPIALTAFASYVTATEKPTFGIHIGYSESLCVLIREGKLLASHGSELGYHFLDEAYFQDTQEHLNEEALSQLSSSTTLKDTYPKFSKAVEKLSQELGWKMISASKETKLKEEAQLFMTGVGALDVVQRQLQTIVDDPFIDIGQDKFLNESPSNLKRFAIAIGLALIAQPETAIGINFRKNEFAYPTPWKRYQKPLLMYAGLSLLLALSFYLFGESYLGYRRDKIKESYLSMLSLIQKPYEEFEASYETKHPNEKLSEGIRPIQELSQESIEKRLDFLETEIRSIPDTFPLQPNVPRVSDVLAWLSTHPKVQCDEGQTDCLPLTIENFGYALVKRPEQNKKNEKYQVKVDLEFSTASPRIAREFHDALIAPNDMIDPKGEVKWSANRGRYRTSFFLKDKTQYLSPLRG